MRRFFLRPLWSMGLVGVLSFVPIPSDCAYAQNGPVRPEIVFLVTSANDTGTGTLRQAILYANATTGTDPVEIHFAISVGPPPAGDVWIIQPATALPEIARPNVTVDALTQPGASCNNLIQGNSHSLKVVLDGSGLTASENGIDVATPAQDVAVSGLVISNFSGGYGIASNGERTSVQCTFVGTDATGSSAAPNRSGVLLTGDDSSLSNSLVSGNNRSGVLPLGDRTTVKGCLVGTKGSGSSAIPNGTFGVYVEATSVTIGGVGTADGNVISGNVADGILVNGTSVNVLGNRIGTNRTGTSPIPNGGHGIEIMFGIDSARVGSGENGAGNLISGNGDSGLYLDGNHAVVQGNKIGTDISGTVSLPNQSHGISVIEDSALIGGLGATEGNLISGNGGHGLFVWGHATLIQGNHIGLDITGTVSLSNGGSGIYSRGNRPVIGGIEAGAGNVISGNREAGIEVVSGELIEILGNYIGTSTSGGDWVPNDSSGIWISGSVTQPSHVTIGGVTAAARNVISGNEGDGIRCMTALNLNVYGNYIGLDGSGLGALSNGRSGVHVERLCDIDLGNTAPGSGNVVSGNTVDGITMMDGGGDPNVDITNNYIGTDPGGSYAIPNGTGIRTLDGFMDCSLNLISGNLGAGIYVGGPAEPIITYNYIGTDRSGTYAIPNGQAGVHCLGDCYIGLSTGEGNLISGNAGVGVYLESAAFATPRVRHNRIGTDWATTKAIPNGTGGIAGNSEAQILYNIISGNAAHGIDIEGRGLLWIHSNRIGTDISGTFALPNAGSGIVGRGSGYVGPHDTYGGAGNVIAFNLQNGIEIWTGLDDWEIRGNSIHHNAGLGIDLGGDGVTSNDGGLGADPPPQNYPFVQPIVNTGDPVELTFSLNTTPSTLFEVEIFRSQDPDGTGYGEGRTHVATIPITTSPSGYITHSEFRPSSEFPIGSWISATASIEGALDDPGQTSEFSPAVRVEGPMVQLDARVFLEGPYSGEELMATPPAFRAAVPNLQPYSSLAYAGTLCEHHGEETMPATNASAVDWVVVSLRTSGLSEVARRAAIVTADGTIVDADGTSPIPMYGAVPGDYYVVICHRNHLAIMSKFLAAFFSGPDLNTGTYDFTTAMAKAYGADPMKGLGPGGTAPFGMIAGNAVPGPDLTSADFDAYVTQSMSAAAGYRSADFNMNGDVQALDFNLFLANSAAGASSQVP